MAKKKTTVAATSSTPNVNVKVTEKPKRCDVKVRDRSDPEFESAYGGCFVASCGSCKTESSPRSTEDRARAELDQLCQSK